MTDKLNYPLYPNVLGNPVTGRPLLVRRYGTLGTEIPGTNGIMDGQLVGNLNTNPDSFYTNADFGEMINGVEVPVFPNYALNRRLRETRIEKRNAAVNTFQQRERFADQNFQGRNLYHEHVVTIMERNELRDFNEWRDRVVNRGGWFKYPPYRAHEEAGTVELPRIMFGRIVNGAINSWTYEDRNIDEVRVTMTIELSAERY